MKYDPHGQPIRFGATVTYSSENRHKVKTEVLEAKTPGVDRALGFEDSPSQASFWSTGNAAVASTFYDGTGPRPRPVCEERNFLLWPIRNFSLWRDTLSSRLADDDLS